MLTKHELTALSNLINRYNAQARIFPKPLYPIWRDTVYRQIEGRRGAPKPSPELSAAYDYNPEDYASHLCCVERDSIFLSAGCLTGLTLDEVRRYCEAFEAEPGDD